MIIKTLTATALAALALAVAGGARAQDLNIDKPSIMVVGSGAAEAAPDRFRVGATVRGQGVDQATALRSLAETQTRVSDGLRRLDGLSFRNLSIDTVSVTPTFNEACESAYAESSACPVTGYVATAAVIFEGAPVERAGDAVSLASQLGARNTSVLDMRLADDATLRADAGRAAFADARRQADVLAAASGLHIVRVLRIQQADERASGSVDAAAAAADAAASGAAPAIMIRPDAPIMVAPQPARLVTQLVVVFEIE